MKARSVALAVIASLVLSARTTPSVVTTSPRHVRFRICEVTTSENPVDAGVPGRFWLGQNCPDPFNPVTTIGRLSGVMKRQDL